MLSKTKASRVKFYSVTDGAIGYELEKAEKRLKSVEPKDNLDIVDLIELYNIKRYFEHELWLVKWSEDTKSHYKDITKIAFGNLAQYFQRLKSETFLKDLKEVSFKYKDDYWELFLKQKGYKNISGDYLKKWLFNTPVDLRYILKHKALVEKYDLVLSEAMTNYEDSTQLLLRSISNYSEDCLYYPRSLTPEMKERIFFQFLNQSKPNLNYVRILLHSNDKEIPKSKELKALAQETYSRLNKELLSSSHAVNSKITLHLDKDQKEPVEIKRDKLKLYIAYSLPYLDSLKSQLELFEVFRSLFGFLDDGGFITTISKKGEAAFLELEMLAANSEYPNGLIFNQKNSTALHQLAIFEHYLAVRELSIIDLLESFLNKINVKIAPSRISLQFPDAAMDKRFLNHFLSSQIEPLLKQYRHYVQDGKIDRNLLKYDTKAVHFSEVPSLSPQKYAYLKPKKLDGVIHSFFSSQSNLSYTEEFKSKHETFFDLICNESVKLVHFEDFQRPRIQTLVSEGYLIILSDETIRIKNEPLLLILHDIHKNEVLSYWHYPEIYRLLIEQKVKEEIFEFRTQLFSLPEQQYLNYCLNNKPYQNGPQLRNKYAHGNIPTDENELLSDYYNLLLVLIQILLKIEDDLNQKKAIPRHPSLNNYKRYQHWK